MIGWNDSFSTFDAPSPYAGANLEAWSDTANMLFAAGCEPQAFALLSSFAAPLMSLFPTSEGGAVVSIYGGRRSGKSVALTAAATVWAMPAVLDLGRGWLQRIAELRHLPVIATALANRDPDVRDRLLTSFIERDDDRQAPEEAEWNTILLSISGEPLVNPRIVQFDLKVPRGLIAPDKNSPSAMERRLLDNRGIAGQAYLRALVNHDMVKWCRKMLASKYALMVDEHGCGLEWRFQMRAIAAAWVAGEICVQAKILECSPERIARWAMGKVLPKRQKSEAAE